MLPLLLGGLAIGTVALATPPPPNIKCNVEIRKANKNTDVILWTIGDMAAGQTETLDVDLRGSLKNGPDCKDLFLSGAWSALFSTDGSVFEKTDYTGRVSIQTNTNGAAGDCAP